MTFYNYICIISLSLDKAGNILQDIRKLAKKGKIKREGGIYFAESGKNQTGGTAVVTSWRTITSMEGSHTHGGQSFLWRARRVLEGSPSYGGH